jgi:DNA repair exonuclease SbcCD ATPase subunit
MKIQSLTARNFLSIGNVTQSINFLNDQLTLVLGEDLDSGGDNSGKRNGTGKCLRGSTNITVKFDTEQTESKFKKFGNSLCTIKNVVDFYKEFPEEIGNICVHTRHGYYRIEFADITAYDSDVIEIILENGLKLYTSPEHLLWSKNTWCAVNKLSIGQKIETIDGEKSIVSLTQLPEKEDLYDLQVAYFHEFYANGIVSHNSTIINALSYAFFGQAITNIKKDNLINKVNAKSMLVTVGFEKNGNNYRIERGRKPNVLKFYINDKEQDIADIDESQGDSRKTQEDINALIGMNHLMFKHIIALNTYTEPFLNLKASDQREFIEHLLGITLLSKKSELLKDQIKLSKDIINQETIKLETIKASNEKVKSTIDNLKLKQRSWFTSKSSEISKIKEAIKNLDSIDIDQEITNHGQLTLYNELVKSTKSIEKELYTLKMMRDQSKRAFDKESSNLKSLQDHKCHACGQELHDSNQAKMITSIEQEIKRHKKQYDETVEKISELESDLSVIKNEMFDKPATFYATIDEAQKHKNNLYELTVHLKQKESESDPYESQIQDLQNTAMQDIDWTVINNQVSLKEHQEFLLKLLTNKDSFIRKKIIDQNLNYINQRLAYYLELIESPHKVLFQSDLQVEITHFGNELDFDNLSRGEKNRVILSLSWAFRDLWENLYQPVNLLFIDELIDNGMDSAGVENCVEILKMMSRERNKNVYLISHKDELINRVDNLLKVTKENGFTTYNISEAM